MSPGSDGRPGVAVVIPTRDRPEMLVDALHSALTQRGVAVEVAVVDDCSDTDLRERVPELSDDRVSFVRLEQHSERSHARNVGLGETAAPFVVFLDDDDLLADGALAALLGAALESEVPVVAGQRLVFDDDGPIPRQPVFSHRVRRPLAEAMWRNLDASDDLVTGRFLFRRDALEKVHGFVDDLRYYEDRHLLWRLAHQGATWHIIPDLVLCSRHHPGSGRYPVGEEWLRAVAPVLASRAACATSTTIRRRLDAWDRVWTGRSHSRHGRTWRATAAIGRAVTEDPTILGSPFYRQELLRAAGKALVPPAVRPGRSRRDRGDGST